MSRCTVNTMYIIEHLKNFSHEPTPCYKQESLTALVWLCCESPRKVDKVALGQVFL
jgi:hypothetical protein